MRFDKFSRTFATDRKKTNKPMRLGFARFHGNSKRTLTHTTSSWCGRRPGWRMSSVFLVTVPLRGQCPIIVVGAGKLPFSPPEHYFHLFSTSFAWHLFSEPQRGIGGLFQYKPVGGGRGQKIAGQTSRQSSSGWLSPKLKKKTTTANVNTTVDCTPHPPQPPNPQTQPKSGRDVSHTTALTITHTSTHKSDGKIYSKDGIRHTTKKRLKRVCFFKLGIGYKVAA